MSRVGCQEPRHEGHALPGTLGQGSALEVMQPGLALRGEMLELQAVA